MREKVVAGRTVRDERFAVEDERTLVDRLDGPHDRLGHLEPAQSLAASGTSRPAGRASVRRARVAREARARSGAGMRVAEALASGD